MTALCLEISVPICGFRQSRAREYAETYPVPPPATLYGFLLSLVGEENRYVHRHVRLVHALKNTPAQSTVLRKIRRVKKTDLTEKENSRPDYQELLTQLNVLVWVSSEQEECCPNLTDRLQQAFTDPGAIQRYGALSLGESRDLVNSVNLLNRPPSEGVLWVSPDPAGLWNLPCWVDHVGSSGTRWRRYTIKPGPFREPVEGEWTQISP